ncbi:hypothetical protein F4553_002879 [Allocatelliglobosispora scoriae]|uniref:Uncharacterized protein n=1 Tax=Allocatelliglobosispora scoriae TaxID=643052 RepID=A0A841BRR8_9ACTN|nr:hypothetical protein [Allocatelliglobosispora scoriae]MBB5869500.1 hypothetical protein [Allocatelliglobosispora scoriae]
MATPSPRPLAASLRHIRRSYAVVAAVLVAYLGSQIAAGWYAGRHPDIYIAMRYLVLLGWAVPLLAVGVVWIAYHLIRGQHRTRTTEMLVSTVDDEPAFVVPAVVHRWSLTLFAVPISFSFQLGMQLNVVAAGKDDVLNLVTIGIWSMLIVPMLGCYALGLRRGSQRLVLTPTGVRIPTAFGFRFAAWGELAPGGPLHPSSDRDPILLRFHSRPLVLRFFSSLVRPDFVADLLRFYVEHPAQRPVIGTADEYARIQVTASLELSNA